MVCHIMPAPRDIEMKCSEYASDRTPTESELVVIKDITMAYRRKDGA